MDSEKPPAALHKDPPDRKRGENLFCNAWHQHTLNRLSESNVAIARSTTLLSVKLSGSFGAYKTHLPFPGARIIFHLSSAMTNPA